MHEGERYKNLKKYGQWIKDAKLKQKKLDTDLIKLRNREFKNKLRLVNDISEKTQNQIKYGKTANLFKMH